MPKTGDFPRSIRIGYSYTDDGKPSGNTAFFMPFFRAGRMGLMINDLRMREFAEKAISFLVSRGMIDEFEEEYDIDFSEEEKVFFNIYPDEMDDEDFDFSDDEISMTDEELLSELKEFDCEFEFLDC